MNLAYIRLLSHSYDKGHWNWLQCQKSKGMCFFKFFLTWNCVVILFLLWWLKKGSLIDNILQQMEYFQTNDSPALLVEPEETEA